MNYQSFDSAQTPINDGVNLIEASAGTGKTYAIAMLALRLIVEKGYGIDQVLIVTFTHAATDELKHRVRLRIVEAQQVLSGKQAVTDDTLKNWAENLSLEPELALRRLNTALLDIDRAGIYTIHGFCQKLLQEYALESGQLFDSELCADINAIKQSCTDDFWRKEVYERPSDAAEILLQIAATPEALLQSIQGITDLMTVYPETEDLDPLLRRYSCELQAQKPLIKQSLDILTEAIGDAEFKKEYREKLLPHIIGLTSWSEGTSSVSPAFEGIELLTSGQLLNGLSGSKFRKSKAGTAEQKKQAYLDSLGIDTRKLDDLPKLLHRIKLSFRHLLWDSLRTQLPQTLQQLNLLSFDDLISRVDVVLRNQKSINLQTAIRENYRAALIDEFQDTDAMQWHIFSTLFSIASHHLYLIGDPKQAIYKFRGADIFSYFAAQQQADHLYTLDQNWRSHPGLVQAVNQLFSHRNQAFFFDKLSFHPVSAALKNCDGEFVRAQQPVSPMEIWQLQPSDSKQGFWSSGKAETSIMISVVNEIIEILDYKNHYAIKSGASGECSIDPEDIAVLVRTNQQAANYQNLLRQVGVPSVINSTVSVFNSIEAENLYWLLSAIAHPGDMGLLKKALTLTWFQLDSQDMLKLSEDESLMELWLSQFQQFHQLWHEQGLLSMMMALMDQLNLQSHIAACIDAERQLTNIYHLLELTQQAAVEEHLGPFKTLDWLYQSIINSESSDGLQLRLESDQQAVRIITMHNAKGLEYNIVFCPCLWHRHKGIAKQQNLISCYEKDTLIADLGSEQFEQRRETALKEELAEDLRLVYVALTRAKYRCYLVWADVRSSKIRNQSGLDYLLFPDQQDDFESQQQTLMTLCSNEPSAISYRSLEADPPMPLLHLRSADSQRLSARQRTRHHYGNWQMSSYTALSALSHTETPELPSDLAQEPETVTVADTPEQPSLPKGALTGNVVHYLLETQSFSQLAEAEDLSNVIATSSQRFGLELSEPDSMQILLKNSVNSPLEMDKPEFCLKNLSESDCLKEMPFYMAINAIDTQAVNEILNQSPAYQALSAKQIQGYLTGFIDLICVYQGRYYVIDYKTNSLNDYQPDNLLQAMREHNYGLQYWLYSLVLHRYLSQRLPDYDYQRHFGGVKYLFLRGMTPDSPLQGVFEDLPDYQSLIALSDLFAINNLLTDS